MTKCRTCKFYEETGTNKDRGRCHRYAPRPDNSNPVVWPLVYASDFCGEYQPDKIKIAEVERQLKKGK